MLPTFSKKPRECMMEGGCFLTPPRVALESLSISRFFDLSPRAFFSSFFECLGRHSIGERDELRSREREREEAAWPQLDEAPHWAKSWTLAEESSLAAEASAEGSSSRRASLACAEQAATLREREGPASNFESVGCRDWCVGLWTIFELKRFVRSVAFRNTLRRPHGDCCWGQARTSWRPRARHSRRFEPSYDAQRHRQTSLSIWHSTRVGFGRDLLTECTRLLECAISRVF